MTILRPVYRHLAPAVVLLISLETISWAQAVLSTPVTPFDASTRISSHYGPRTNPVTHQSQFHGGVDYPGPLGSPIIAVEGGNIVGLNIDANDDWYISIQGPTALFEYIHIFNNNTSDGSLIPITLSMAFLDNNPHTPVDLMRIFILPPNVAECFAIVFWADENKVAATRVLTTPRCAGAPFAGTVTKATVVAGEIIAPVGNSGRSTGPHVHLQANSGNNNPLNYVMHPQANYTATHHLSPTGSAVIFDIDFHIGMDLGVFAGGGEDQDTFPANIVYVNCVFTIGGPKRVPTFPPIPAPNCPSITATPRSAIGTWLSDGSSLGILPSSQAGFMSFVVPIPTGPGTLVCDKVTDFISIKAPPSGPPYWLCDSSRVDLNNGLYSSPFFNLTYAATDVFANFIILHKVVSTVVYY